MLLSKRKFNCSLIQLYSIVVLFLLYLANAFNVDVTNILKLAVLVQFIISLYTNYSINRWLYNAYGIFLSLFFVFILSRIVLDFYGYNDFGQTSFFSSYVFSSEVQFEMLLVIFLSLVSLNVGFLCNNKFSFNYLCWQFNRGQNKNEVYFGKLLVFIGFIPTLFKSLYLGYLVAKHGYLAIFLNPNLFQLPLVISFLSMLFPIGFFLCHMGGLKNKRFRLFINSIFIVSILSEVFIGKRGPVLTQLLILLWFFTFHYGNRISVKKLVTYAVIMILGSQLALNIRSSSNDGVSNLLLSFFYQQGVSVQLLGYAERYNIDNEADFSPVDVFRPIFQNLDIFYHKLSGNSYSYSPSERMERYNNYSMYIANSADSSKFDSGFGLGGSYLVESKLILGISGLILVNIILGFLLSRVEFYSTNSKYAYGVLFLILPDIIYLPRSYLFEFANTQMRPILLFFSIMFVIKLLGKRNHL